jgi:AcrR family transcriptional regulator
MPGPPPYAAVWLTYASVWNVDSASAPQQASARRRRRLSADDWARAALAAIGEGGVAAVAVEPIAARLGATKGSFYWHFRDRRALLEAALRCWEREQTEAVIDAMEAEPDLVRRLRRLFASAIEGELRDRAELTLLAAAGDPAVAAVMRRVTGRRISYMAGVFRELGLAPATARSHALIAYNAYLGYLQLAHAAPEVLPRGSAARERYLDDLLSALLSAARKHNDADN